MVLDVTERAVASALRVIMRADDSSGIIGDACSDLLDLHPAAAAAPPRRLVEWMIRFQRDHPCDFFTIHPVAYAPALGRAGMADYRRRLDELRERFAPRPAQDARWSGPHAHEWFILDLNERRPRLAAGTSGPRGGVAAAPVAALVPSPWRMPRKVMARRPLFAASHGGAVLG